MGEFLKRREVFHAVAFAGVLGAAGLAAVANPRATQAVPGQARRGPESVAAPDSEQRYVQLVPAGDGIIYGLQANGELVWLRHLGWQDGNPSWANGGTPRVLDAGWLSFRWVLASRDGQLFGVTQDGQVTWFRYLLSNPETGEGKWASGSGAVIRSRLGNYEHVCGGPNGVIYGVQPSSRRLFWHCYQAADGSTGASAWSGKGVPVAIGMAWTRPITQSIGAHLVNLPFTDPNGFLYDRDGDKLTRHHYAGADGWDESFESGPLAPGWADLRMAIPMGDGVFYTIDNARRSEPVRAEELVWRRTIKAADNATEVSWISDRDRVVAKGFTIEPLAALQGYPLTLSAPQGAKLGLAVSTGHSEYKVSLLRLAPRGVLSSATRVEGGLQMLPADYRSAGCGWNTTVEVQIGQDWESGIYAARLEADGGRCFDIPFVVRPSEPAAPVAYLWPTFTYNAYNDWGGHSRYTPGPDTSRRKLSLRRPSIFNNVDAAPDPKLIGDLTLLQWLAKERIPVDCYQDGDLDGAGSWLSHYRALVLGIHPEYWTDRMYDRLTQYLADGGRLIYLGGNGIYERVQTDGKAGQTFRTADGGRDLFRDLGRPETQLLGVAYHELSWGTFAPYRVAQDHPLLAGTRLRTGDHFGESGEMGAASGWEVDRRGLPGSAGLEHVIAHGLNTNGGAEMVFRPGPNDGWVFGAGSLTFVGSLAKDAAVRKIVRNVFDLVI